MLTKKTFQCKQCGQCCRPIVKVTERDIAKIEKSGLSRDSFLAYDPKLEHPTQKDTLKQNHFVCMFLNRTGKKYFCEIYECRPEVCRKYPFIEKNVKLEDCKPRNWKYWMELEELI